MAKPHKYTGILAKPAPLDLRGLDIQSAAARFREWWAARLDALFSDCGVDPSSPNGWTIVALILMQRHVPGFSDERERRGAPRKTTLSPDDISIFIEMNSRTTRGISVRAAAEEVARRRRKGEKPAAIDMHYRRMMRKIVEGITLQRKERTRQKSG